MSNYRDYRKGSSQSEPRRKGHSRSSLAERAALNRTSGNLSAKYSERAQAKRQQASRSSSARVPQRTRPPAGKRPAPQQRPPTRKRRRRYRLEPRAKVLLAVLAILLLLGLGSCAKAIFSSGTSTEEPVVAESSEKEKTTDESFARRILSDSAILVNAKTGEVIFEKNADEQEKPASLVKLMTVYTALKIKGNDLSEVVAVPEAAFQNLGEAAVSGLSPNELVSIKDLIYATILSSGGDAAQALALICSRHDNMDSFIERMNENAEELGMRNTRYTNVIGLDGDNQLSTARDLSKLMLKAVADDRFYSVLTSDHYNTRTSSEHAQGVLLLHTLKTHMNEFPQEMKPKGYEIVGGKTGYTSEAGICLASIAKNEAGDMYIAVTLHAGGDLNNYYPAVKDAIQLYNYAFNKDGR